VGSVAKRKPSPRKATSTSPARVRVAFPGGDESTGVPPLPPPLSQELLTRRALALGADAYSIEMRDVLAAAGLSALPDMLVRIGVLTLVDLKIFSVDELEDSIKTLGKKGFSMRKPCVEG